MADELGDVLLQVVFHAQVAAEHATFTITDITSAICAKMISRHRHIFGENQCATAEEVLNSWEQIKKEEKGLKSTADVMRDVPQGLPALMRASKVQNKAHQVGFDWAAPLQALEKVTEETDEVRAELAAAAIRRKSSAICSLPPRTPPGSAAFSRSLHWIRRRKSSSAALRRWKKPPKAPAPHFRQ